jgi:RNA polymerase sigma-70 factor (ECF subfamily)
MVLEETEKELIEGCQRGDSASFRALFDRSRDKIYTIALRYSGDPEIAQDIAQETFLKLFAGIGAFRGDSRFDTWLYRLVVNACFDQKRKTRRLIPVIEAFFDALISPSESALDKIVRSEMSGQVRSAVENLPPDQRIVIVLRYSQALSYEDIAGVLQCSAGTVASRLNRAHKTLALRLGRRNDV